MDRAYTKIPPGGGTLAHMMEGKLQGKRKQGRPMDNLRSRTTESYSKLEKMR